MGILKTLFIMLALSGFNCIAKAQDQSIEDTVKIDLDKDQQTDTVIFIRKDQQISVKLSSQKYKTVKSAVFEEIDPQTAGIKRTTTGFIFSNSWMRAGYDCQFRYDAASGRVRLIGMSRYEFGNAAGDGSGKSSVNLLTNDYAGDWNYFDDRKEILVKMPTIKRRLQIPKTYLDNNIEKTYDQYATFCSKEYDAEQKKLSGSPKR